MFGDHFGSSLRCKTTQSVVKPLKAEGNGFVTMFVCTICKCKEDNAQVRLSGNSAYSENASVHQHGNNIQAKPSVGYTNTTTKNTGDYSLIMDFTYIASACQAA